MVEHLNLHPGCRHLDGCGCYDSWYLRIKLVACSLSVKFVKFMSSEEIGSFSEDISGWGANVPVYGGGFSYAYRLEQLELNRSRAVTWNKLSTTWSARFLPLVSPSSILPLGQKLAGGFKYCLFSPWKLGKWFPFWRACFSNGLVQPPTS